MNPWDKVENVVVVGLGITGLSVVKHLLQVSKPLSIQVIDTRLEPPGAAELPHNVSLHKGGWNTSWLQNADLIVVNPGIALATPELQQASLAGINLVGDIELFAWQVDKPVIAITGSNGKSTVTDLSGVVAKASGLTVGVGGNIGVPALDLLQQDADLYILELSSFQLETTSSLHLAAAAFLNLSEDHMDRYEGMQDYREAKMRIFQHAEQCIVNHQDKATYPVDSNKSLITFGLDSLSDYCLGQFEGQEYLMANGKPVISTTELTLVGRHNVANVLVVLALLEQVGVNINKGLSALKSYSGLTHRCQLVADNRGVKWVNDSKATNVASTAAALSGLDCKGTLYLLVGGDGKGADFSELADILGPMNVQLCCYGADADRLLSQHPSARKYQTMNDIIAEISPKLEQGDMVMLSPACASFDQYSNFMARGDAFIELASQYA
ncbi:UDP-N-acetylmuramoyl-L-alanine--D-glutamate ligase [Vibrio genomosp. F10 str. 9ZC157]|uniref:UDP-N-acetylmuramoyl-L-alanine--D-glutamate ligase n=1 Tax=Vibrio genomosp. F10 TaxID=723171 RepID=UPI00030ADF64|nr:UDP-N-acetylmuramoyl-L-alanine--D-glutamate ligase [Vibrio genomosp. F10]OEE97635.1 UDP-N-acetylmuramoyl-L-alanine--D-glutamate ligase [Vibrio genomosp. F10 str. 9ZC157]